MAEFFELVDEAVAVAVGVFGLAADEVVLAEVGVWDVRGRGCARRRRGSSGRSRSLLFGGRGGRGVAGIGRRGRCLCCGWRPWRLRSARRAAIWILCGSCRSACGRRTGSGRGTSRPRTRGARRSGTRVMSAPISAISSSAVRLSTPGIVSSSATFSAKGAITTRSARQRDDRFIEEVDVREDLRDDQRVVPVKRPASAWLSAGSCVRILPLASSASTSGSWCRRSALRASAGRTRRVPWTRRRRA